MAIFKDPRQLEEFQCDCENDTEENLSDFNFNFLDIVIKDRLV